MKLRLTSKESQDPSQDDIGVGADTYKNPGALSKKAQRYLLANDHSYLSHSHSMIELIDSSHQLDWPAQKQPSQSSPGRPNLHKYARRQSQPLLTLDNKQLD